MTVTPDKTARAARAREALPTSHAELRVAKEESELLPALERSGADLAAVLAREPRLAGSSALVTPGSSARSLPCAP